MAHNEERTFCQLRIKDLDNLWQRWSYGIQRNFFVPAATEVNRRKRAEDWTEESKTAFFNKYSTTEEKNIPQCNKCNLEDINIKIWISGGESFHIAELNNEHKKTKKELSRFSATVRLFVIHFER